MYMPDVTAADIYAAMDVRTACRLVSRRAPLSERELAELLVRLAGRCGIDADMCKRILSTDVHPADEDPALRWAAVLGIIAQHEMPSIVGDTRVVDTALVTNAFMDAFDTSRPVTYSWQTKLVFRNSNNSCFVHAFLGVIAMSPLDVRVIFRQFPVWQQLEVGLADRHEWEYVDEGVAVRTSASPSTANVRLRFAENIIKILLCMRNANTRCSQGTYYQLHRQLYNGLGGGVHVNGPAEIIEIIQADDRRGVDAQVLPRIFGLTEHVYQIPCTHSLSAVCDNGAVVHEQRAVTEFIVIPGKRGTRVSIADEMAAHGRCCHEARSDEKYKKTYFAADRPLALIAPSYAKGMCRFKLDRLIAISDAVLRLRSLIVFDHKRGHYYILSEYDGVNWVLLDDLGDSRSNLTYAQVQEHVDDTYGHTNVMFVYSVHRFVEQDVFHTHRYVHMQFTDSELLKKYTGAVLTAEFPLHSEIIRLYKGWRAAASDTLQAHAYEGCTVIETIELLYQVIDAEFQDAEACVERYRQAVTRIDEDMSPADFMDAVRQHFVARWKQQSHSFEVDEKMLMSLFDRDSQDSLFTILVAGLLSTPPMIPRCGKTADARDVIPRGLPAREVRLGSLTTISRLGPNNKPLPYTVVSEAIPPLVSFVYSGRQDIWREWVPPVFITHT